MKPVLIMAAGAAVLALGAACSASDWEHTPRPPQAGTVTELEHEPGYWEEDCYTQSVYDSRTRTYKSKQVCSDRWVPDCYEVDWVTPEGDELEECATEEVFEGLALGDVYIEGMNDLATHTPWLTPSPSPSTSPSPTNTPSTSPSVAPSASASAS